jgi:hypothetical protein
VDHGESALTVANHGNQSQTELIDPVQGPPRQLHHWVVRERTSGSSISYIGLGRLFRAVSATIEFSADLHPVPDDTAMAMLTDGSNGLNGALEAIECVPLTGRNQLKGFIVFVAANFASGHKLSLVRALQDVEQLRAPYPAFL